MLLNDGTLGFLKIIAVTRSTVTTTTTTTTTKISSDMRMR